MSEMAKKAMPQEIWAHSIPGYDEFGSWGTKESPSSVKYVRQDVVTDCQEVAADMVKALKWSESTFRWYAELHAAKPDLNKAKRNYDMANMCAEVLAKAEGRV